MTMTGRKISPYSLRLFSQLSVSQTESINFLFTQKQLRKSNRRYSRWKEWKRHKGNMCTYNMNVCFVLHKTGVYVHKCARAHIRLKTSSSLWEKRETTTLRKNVKIFFFQSVLIKHFYFQSFCWYIFIYICNAHV